MVLLQYQGLPSPLADGLELLVENNPLGAPLCAFQLSPSGDNSLIVSQEADGSYRLGYRTTSDFFRGISYILYPAGGVFEPVRQCKRFSLLSAMLDLSRNGVMTVDSIKRYLRHMALMGFDSLLLYMEDIYQLENRPYFGYMRGRYTREELRELDCYGQKLGISLVPCVQTLGHMEQYLKWAEADEIKDTDSVLLVDSEATYSFLDEMLGMLSDCFTSRRIHIGMDEAHDVGLGRYLNKFGHKNRLELLVGHLNRVTQLCEKHQLRPMMWGDMFFRLSSKSGAYYDLDVQITPEICAMIPANLDIVYWDYYNVDKSFYSQFIQNQAALTKSLIFAGGVWCWRGALPDYHTTIATTRSGLAACLENGVQEVIATLWADDGYECSLFLGLLGLQFYAETCYRGELPTTQQFGKRFSAITGADYRLLLEMSAFQEQRPTNFEAAVEEISQKPMQAILKAKIHNGRKYMWQDPLCGVLDESLIRQPIDQWYGEAAQRLADIRQVSAEWKPYQDFAVSLLVLMKIKTHIAARLKPAYDQGDFGELERLCGELEQLHGCVVETHQLHRMLWYSENKPFGFEVLDIRYGGLLARTDTAIQRLQEHIRSLGTVRLPELEEVRLPFTRLNGYYRYQGFVTGSMYV